MMRDDAGQSSARWCWDERDGAACWRLLVAGRRRKVECWWMVRCVDSQGVEVGVSGGLSCDLMCWMTVLEASVAELQRMAFDNGANHRKSLMCAEHGRVMASGVGASLRRRLLNLRYHCRRVAPNWCDVERQ